MIRIGNNIIGESQPTFIIAEAGVNHNGDIDLAMKLIDAAAEAGADCVKFQTFNAERLVTLSAPKAAYQKITNDAATQYEMLKRLELPAEAYPLLKQRAEKNGLVFLSTPFDETAADFLESLGIPGFKVSSSDLTNTPFLGYLARKGLPIILSTGMSDIEEIEEAVNAINDNGNKQIILLQCTSDYPASPENVNLIVIETLAKRFGLLVGFSDHTVGSLAASLAVALGASVLEKHFTMDKNFDGPDHKASAEPHEFSEMVSMVRLSEKLLGSSEKKITESEKDIVNLVRKSVVAKVPILTGTIIDSDMLTIKRPGIGIPPAGLKNIVGKMAKRDIATDDVIRPDDFGMPDKS